MTERLHLSAERAPFVMLPRWLLYHRQVGEGAKFVYCVLHDLVAGREGPTRPVTRAELAERCGVSANTIDRRLAELVAVAAVDKEPQILAGGQVGNIYRVWLTPPDQRPGTRVPTDEDARSARLPNAGDPPGALVDNRFPTDGEARSAGVPSSGELAQLWGGSLPADGDPIEKEEREETPPQPPRTAGGPQGSEEHPTPGAVAPRAAGTNPRAARTNPRADAELAEAARLEAEAAARQAELEAAVDARRAADIAAEVETERLEAEALALSACLDDETLTGIVELVTGRMAGPLARSPLAISRSVVAWCRTAVAQHPGRLTISIAAGLAAGLGVGEGHGRLDLPPAPAGTAPLRHRIAALRTPVGVG